jgi:hypothetical protein
MNEQLKSAIAASLSPVRPLPRPSRRLLPIVPLALLLLAAAPVVFQFRDLAALGWTWSWGASALQVAIGLAVIAVALSHAVPGRAWPAWTLVASGAAVLLLFFTVTYGTWMASPIALARGWWTIGAICALSSAISALPIVVLAAALVVRAFPLHPTATGAIAGFGAGLIGDAGWRLFCHYSEPAHVLAAHFGGVLLAAAVGALLVRALWQRA